MIYCYRLSTKLRRRKKSYNINFVEKVTHLTFIRKYYINKLTRNFNLITSMPCKQMVLKKYIYYFSKIYFFLFVWIKFLLPLENTTWKETKLILFCTLSTHQTNFDFFFTLSFIASVKAIKQNIRENIVQHWLNETSIKILHA